MPRDAKPYTKAQQTARGPKRYRRKIAGPKTWQKLHDAKRGPCRSCGDPGTRLYELHHVVPRSSPWFGDDVPENLVPLCRLCHSLVTMRDREASRAVLSTLTDDEYAYAIGRGGEAFFERCYGIEYQGGHDER